MSAPLTYGIAANAKNADCAAFFLNWVATNETARQINVDIGGSNPGGPTDLPIPTAAAGSVTNETLAAGNDVAKDNGAWTSSPTRRVPSSPRAGRLSCRSSSAGSRTLPAC